MKMRKSWKVVLAALLSAVLVGTVVGGAVAQTATGDKSPANTLLSRVAQILGIDQQKLEDAFNQAQKEMQAEALDARLKNLVDQGTITQQQADQYKEWWQARPDVMLPGPLGGFGPGGHPPAPTSTPTPTPSSTSL